MTILSFSYYFYIKETLVCIHYADVFSTRRRLSNLKLIVSIKNSFIYIDAILKKQPTKKSLRTFGRFYV